MTMQDFDWDFEPPVEPELEYGSLLRGLRRTRGFGLFFVQCSPAGGTRLIERTQQDLPQKRIDVLPLTEPITNLYDIIDSLPNKNELDVLFVQGVEHSLYDYEKHQLWQSSKERYAYSEKGLPRLLGHLNLSRERFRDSFNICLVFLVPLFALKYLIRRAPDFFDWRSGVLEFALDSNQVQRESNEVRSKRFGLEDYAVLSPAERRSEILKIQALVEEPQLTAEAKADLYSEQGLLYATTKEYEAAIDSYDQALKVKPDKDEAWNNRGTALDNLGRFEEAIDSYDQALKVKPDKHEAWYNRGFALGKLGRFEEAIDSYDQALKVKPDKDEAWNNRGTALDNLGRFEEAIDSYDQALKVKPDKDEAWYNRGVALGNLGRFEAAIDSYDQALKVKPDQHEAWNNRGNALFNLGRFEEAIDSYDQALKVKPDVHEAWYNRGVALGSLGRLEEEIDSYDQALKVKPDKHEAWYNRGFALGKLGRLEAAIDSYDQALKVKPDKHEAWYNKACCYALQGQMEAAIVNLQRAIELDEKCREMAKTEAGFEAMREDDRFQALIEA